MLSAIVNMCNWQNSQHKFEIEPAQFANFLPKLHPNPNVNPNPKFLTLLKSRIPLCKFRRLANCVQHLPILVTVVGREIELLSSRYVSLHVDTCSRVSAASAANNQQQQQARWPGIGDCVWRSLGAVSSV